MVINRSNNLRQQRNILYVLSRTFGRPIQVHRPGDSTYDPETGQQSRAHTIIPVRRAVVLKGEDVRKFVYDLTFIASNKNFTYGGLFDEMMRLIIIDAKQLPALFDFDQDDIIYYDSLRYEIKAIDRYEDNRGFILTCKNLSSTVGT